MKRWRFKNWQSSLNIGLVKSTSVLELSYRDTDKKLVLPVIQKISTAYQAYSGRDRERGIEQGIEYLEKQIKLYNQKSLRSLRAAQEYGIEHDLTALKGDGTNDTEINSGLNIEAIRISAANKIRNVNEQLKAFDQLINKPEYLMYSARIIPELAAQKLPKELDEIDTRLALLRSKFTDQDESVQRLLARRRLLIEVLKRQTYGYLYAQRVDAQARLKAAERPKGVLIKYRELLRSAKRDEATLTKLEAERQILALEQARKEEPWELISTPTLLDIPVSPNKKRIVALGLLAGLIAGSGAALFIDLRKGLVYSEDELENLLPCRLIKHLPTINQGSWAIAADLLASGPLADTSVDSAIALIPVGKLDRYQLEAFSKELSRALNGRELIVSTDLRETSRCATQLLVTSPGVATRSQISQLCQALALQGSPLAGWVLIDPELNLE